MDDSTSFTICILKFGWLTVVCDGDVSQMGNTSDESLLVPKSSDCSSKLESLTVEELTMYVELVLLLILSIVLSFAVLSDSFFSVYAISTYGSF